jgi:multidrug efflux system outer membrane protein
MKQYLFISLILVAVSIAGCSKIPAVGPDYVKPEIALPQSWSEENKKVVISESKNFDPSKWWEVFQDEMLNLLLKEAISKNKELSIAESRLREAREGTLASYASFWPQISGSANVSRNRISNNTFQGSLISGGAAGGDTGGVRRSFPGLLQTLWTAALDISWEIDIFGYNRRMLEAAEASAEGAEENLKDVQVSLTAETARTYFECEVIEKRLLITENNVHAQSESLDIVKSRFDAGLASELDLAQARAQLETTRAELPALESALAACRNSLAVILGTTEQEMIGFYPNRDSHVATLVDHLPSEILAGIPSDLLKFRPDVRRAERSVQAANAQLGVAIAEQYPRFSLGGQLSLESLRSRDWLDASSKAWRFTPATNLPFFTGGRISANIHVQEEREEQALRTYEQTILNAMSESESTLTAVFQERKRYDSLRKALDASKRALELSQELYRQGLVDFLRVIESQRATYGAEDALALSELNLLTNFTRAYKALGFGH